MNTGQYGNNTELPRLWNSNEVIDASTSGTGRQEILYFIGTENIPFYTMKVLNISCFY